MLFHLKGGRFIIEIQLHSKDYYVADFAYVVASEVNIYLWLEDLWKQWLVRNFFLS